MNRWRYRWLLLALWWVPAHLPAYTVAPNLLVLGSGGRDSSAFIKLSNREPRAAAVEIVVNEFHRDLDGRGVPGKQADEHFIVYPAQVILMPGDEVMVQVRWIGPADLGAEQAFALTTREVKIPPKDPEQQAGEGARLNINVLMNYDVRVYVAPRGARPRLAVEAISTRTQPGQERDQLEVTLVNRGTAHQSLKDLSLVLTALDTDGNPLRQPAVTLSAQDIPGMSAALLANSQRRLLIPWPAALPAGRVGIRLSR